ncbi:MAG: sulfite exporter TauE/SafE family protein [Deltaproteobacteria bacterium]|nr:sulfite exporter TauE/SafE family protein [Deltaproteobacteria bacterium]
MTLIVLGFLIGTLGTLIGAGGGFIMIPILFYLYPHASAAYITGISLAVVCLNAISGSAAYARQKKIDYRNGIYFAVAALPGSVLGAYAIQYIPRSTFNFIFGILLAVVSIYLLIKPEKKKSSSSTEGSQKISSAKIKLGILISTFVGFLSSILGIGGGIIHVPLLIHVLDFPVHRATATSHFILAILTFVATLTHIYQGIFDELAVRSILLLGLGVIFGAQLGAYLSKHIHSRWIVRGLAIALIMMAIRLFQNWLSA